MLRAWENYWHSLSGCTPVFSPQHWQKPPRIL
jgi:hypothetical protein